MMSHCDPTILALAALGEDIDADDAAHLESCEICLADAAELTEVVTAGRAAPLELPEVPAGVWASIQQELALDRAPDGDDRIRRTNLATVTAAPRDASHDADPSLAPVVPMRPRRSFFSVAAVAAAAGAIVGGTVVWAAAQAGDSQPGSPSGTLVAQAVLSPLTDSVPAPGEATVVDSPDGEVVRVDATALRPTNGFYEVWLLDADATKLVALGALPAGSIGTFTVPPGVSITDYPVVDISLEPLDGDPAHSKNSLMRGTLEA
jgi:hypothetical protein